MTEAADKIPPVQAGSLPGLFRERVRRCPDRTAYIQFDPASHSWCRTTWGEMGREVGRWQAAMQREGLESGDRVAMMVRNCREWVVFDQASLGLGLVTVPLYPDDRAENAAYILEHCQARLLLVEGKRQWRRMQAVHNGLDDVQRIVSINTVEPEDRPDHPRLESLGDWLFGAEGPMQEAESHGEALATIVYTSGTTGRPKGVMLSHNNLLANAFASSECAPIGLGDRFLSFLPLSHTLERTVGYYMAMMVGAEVAFARSVASLGEDIATLQPTILVSVPRIYERVYTRIYQGLKRRRRDRQLFEKAVEIGWHRFEQRHGRAAWHPRLLAWPLLDRLVARKVHARLGGRLRFAICGGAPLAPELGRTFVGLGVPLYQGYGVTEASPVITVNRIGDNVPKSIGRPLPGVEVEIEPGNSELLTRSSSVMMGYWRNEEATRAAIDPEGWLHTGDQACMDAQGHIYITGRLKEIIVMANGEKVPPADMELAISMDTLFEQVMLIGEGRPYLSVLLVLNEDEWNQFGRSLGLDPFREASLRDRRAERAVLARVAERLAGFPGYAQVRRATLTLEPWTVDDGLLTPTLKLKRARIQEHHAEDIARMYQGYSLEG